MVGEGMRRGEGGCMMGDSFVWVWEWDGRGWVVFV